MFFNRRKRMMEASQELQNMSNSLYVQAGKKVAAGGLHIGRSIISANIITDAISGYQGGKNLAEGIQLGQQANELREAARILKDKAENTRWYHLW
ncbi:MAG: hypothetical protein ACK587_05490 [Cyanobacteriota bacterium]